MNWLETKILKRIFARNITQKPGHAEYVENVFVMIRQAWASEFTEDNVPTQTQHLLELFCESEKTFYTNAEFNVFENLTWKQCEILHNAAHNDLFIYDNNIAPVIVSMLSKKVKAIHTACTQGNRIRVYITDKGREQYKRLCVERPELFKEKDHG